MHTRIAIAALMLGCGTPEDAFVGVYSGSYECSGSFSDGEPYSEGPAEQIIRIDRDLDGGLFIAGARCAIPLRVVSSTRAEVVRSSCDATLSTGLEVRATYESGALTLDEPYLFSRRGSRLDPLDGSAWFLTVSCDFDGTRIE